MALRREALRERAAGDPAAPPELLAAVAFISVLSNEPAEVGADLATRALLAGGSARPGSEGRPWFSFAAWFSQATFSLLWAERYAELRPLLDASIAQARATGDGGRLAIGLARPRLARAPTRRSERRRGRRAHGACRDGAPRTAHVPRPERRCARQDARRPGRARGGRGGARAARLRSRERIRSRPRSFASPAAGCGSHKGESPRGSRTSWPSASPDAGDGHAARAISPGGRRPRSPISRSAIASRRDASQKRSSSSRGHSARRARSASRSAPRARRRR